MISFIEIENKFKTEVILCNVGASIYDIKTKDNKNNIESILYTTKNKNDFPYDGSYFGKTIGRTGGRVSNSKFILNGIDYKILSDDPNGLHGGKEGLSFKEFDFKKTETDEYIEVLFYYESKDLESGYPGNLSLKVIYRLFKNVNKLTITYEGLSDKDTLLNLSNHSYFNLSGNAKNNILDHELFINASNMEKIEKLIPVKIEKCSDIYSFKSMHKIGDYLMNKEIIDNTNGYDFPYIFDNASINLSNIILKDNESKRVLKIKTTYPVVVVYTCNYVGNEIMNNNEIAKPYYAVCLECQYHPNGINSDFIKDKKDILKKGSLYNETIEYYFEVTND